MESPRDRIPYSPIIDRPPLVLPDGARMVVWTILNVEYWDSTNPQPRTILPPPMGQPLLPDVPNWSWQEYGNRVGFWRLRDLFKHFRIVPTLGLNSSVIESYKPIAEVALEEGWEFLGHGYIQAPMQKLDDQRGHIQRSIEAIRHFSGKNPRGWLSPGLTETMETLDILAECGIEYVGNWPLDDQPVELKVKSGKMYALPYPVETNDLIIMSVQNHSSNEFANKCIDQFDRLYQDSATITRIMGICLHTFISGVPHRVKYVEQVFDHITSKPDVLLWTGEQVLDWYKGQIGES